MSFSTFSEVKNRIVNVNFFFEKRGKNMANTTRNLGV